MDVNPSGGGHKSLDFPPIEQVPDASVHMAQTSSTKVVIPNSKQLHFQWSSPKVRSWILSSPMRSSTTAEEGPGANTQVLTSRLDNVHIQEDNPEKDKHV
jgi:hypothetical protein